MQHCCKLPQWLLDGVAALCWVPRQHRRSDSPLAIGVRKQWVGAASAVRHQAGKAWMLRPWISQCSCRAWPPCPLCEISEMVVVGFEPGGHEESAVEQGLFC